MATKSWKSKFYRPFSFCFFISLILAISLGANNSTAQTLSPSYYSQFSGDKFFILTESSFNSDEIAKIRLEAPRRGGLEAYAGVDIFVYSVSNPEEFLKSQSNLHRPSIKANYKGENILNPMVFLWDIGFKKSRLVMRHLLSEAARVSFLHESPEMRYKRPNSYERKYKHNSQFGKLSQFKRVSRFRYPIWQAKPLDPTNNKKLKGSTIARPKTGNVYIPIGRMNPGLYVVEALVGQFRATTLLFVSNTVAVTKMSGDQQFIWSVDKTKGTPRPETSILLTDGVGVLKSGKTDADGVLILDKQNLNQNYIIGRDSDGGVFVSENFYYDSELYADKVYLFTDRPIYQPGETVFLKLIGRNFADSKNSSGLKGGDGRLVITDPVGTPISVQKMVIDSRTGSDTKFQLPAYAKTGGYTISLDYLGTKYNAFFRVASFSKPHFQVDVLPEKRLYKTGETIKGTIAVTYPNGEPVSNARVEFKARSQKLTVVEGEIQYAGLFPVQLKHEVSSADHNGVLKFDLPATTEPSRYVLRVRVSDSSSYRVTAVKEILVHEGFTFYSLQTEKNFSKVGESVIFSIVAQTLGNSKTEGNKANAPVKWEAIRLSDQTKTEGLVAPDAENVAIQFDKTGNYSLFLKNADGVVLGTRRFFVEGEDNKAVAGTIDIVLDKADYRIGDTATALITFSEQVKEGLLTLERDNVTRHCLMSKGADWISIKKVSDRQWAAEIDITEDFSPNITLSLAYVTNGQYVFRNKGIKVAIPEIDILVKTDRVDFKPGETVTVNLETRLKGKPVSSWLTISVVDEMIYVLQPEIAPKIGDFFYHRRRNQVKTSSSLAFHTFDVATKARGNQTAGLNTTRARPMKFRDGSRREDINTAVWLPGLKTDENGKVSFRFRMPDSITRWRLTARGITDEGAVGQTRSFLLSEQKYFTKWTGPTTFRNGDKPVISLGVFNLSDSIQRAKISAEGMGARLEKEMVLRVGANYVEMPFKAERSGDVTATLAVDGAMVDQLATHVTIVPRRWKSTRSIAIPLIQGETTVTPPDRSFNLRLSLAQNSFQEFLRVAGGLIDYPYGCVEQTSSKLIPLSIAYMHIKNSGVDSDLMYKLQNRLTANRFRLIQMAGPKAAFTWWGNRTGSSAFMTGYAYYADWLTTKALGIDIRQEHWENLLKVYSREKETSLLRNASVLWMAEEMGLPVKSMTQGLIEKTMSQMQPVWQSEKFNPERSYVIEDSQTVTNRDLGMALLDVLAVKLGLSLPDDFESRTTDIFETFKNSPNPLAGSIWLMKQVQKNGVTDDIRNLAGVLLKKVSYEMATVDRAFTLMFINTVFDWKTNPADVDITLPAPWKKTRGHFGQTVWEYQAAAPKEFAVSSPAANLSNLQARLVYDTYAKEESSLPIQISRSFHALRPEKNSDYQYRVTDKNSTKLSSTALYVDEIKIMPPYYGRNFRFGILEIPIPPGADVEMPTYGMKINSQKGTMAISKARFITGDRYYSIPIDQLSEPVTFRFLVRFSQKGSFILPRARFYQMYDPTAKAFEESGSRVVVQ